MKGVKEMIERLLNENPDCNIWVTYLSQEEDNGDLWIIVGGSHESLLEKKSFVKYEKLKPSSSRVSRDRNHPGEERTCFVVSKKVARNVANPWNRYITQMPCPPTQFVFSLDNSDLKLDLI